MTTQWCAVPSARGGRGRFTARDGWILVAVTLVVTVVLAVLPSGRAQAAPILGPALPAPAGFGLPAGYVPSPSPYQTGYDIAQNVRMSDGVELHASIRYPLDPVTQQPAKGPFPVVLSVTPYGAYNGLLVSAIGGVFEEYNLPVPGDLGGVINSVSQEVSAPVDLVNRGYINVIADVRGTGASNGQWSPISDRNAQDIKELVDWSSRLPNSSGKVGMFGYSFPGVEAMHAATTIGENSPLKAIFAMNTDYDLLQDVLGDGQWAPLISLFVVIWPGLWLQYANLWEAALVEPQRALGIVIDRLRGLIGDNGQGVLGIAANLLTSGLNADNPIVGPRLLSNDIANIVHNDVAVYAVGGDADIFQGATFKLYSALQNAAAGRDPYGPMPANAKPDPRYQILQGPWPHVTTGFAPTGRIRTEEHTAAWFDHWLKDIDNGVDRNSVPLNVIDANGNALSTSVYPFTETTPTSYYLDGNRLSSSPPSGDQTPDRWDYSLINNPCSREFSKATGGILDFVLNLLSLGNLHDPCAQTEVGPQNGLTYSTAPFDQAMTLAGPITANLFASSTATDAAFDVAVEDVAPDGSVRQLTEGALTATRRAVDEDRSWRTADGTLYAVVHQNTSTSVQPLVPGEVTEFQVRVFPTVQKLDAGHSLRIRISSSNFPATMPHPLDIPGLLGSTVNIEHSARFPSKIVLPLGPASATAWR
ncbi:CocE/NonD family hydrolase [Nocardia sp. NPDC056000]|uniref:CocE/NonD family hydrolase n=1 Tax=Nocardia sp. NPDC056000 TaxID=3345674 RepID=UPI0035DC3D4E